MGVPSRDKLRFVTNEVALRPILKYENSQVPPFSQYFPPNTNKDGLDLLQRMLEFNPSDRPAVEECLRHPYLKDFYQQMPEPNCDKVFDFEFERNIADSIITEDEVRRLMFEEVCRYRPVAGGDGLSRLADAKLSSSSGSGKFRLHIVYIISYRMI